MTIAFEPVSLHHQVLTCWSDFRRDRSGPPPFVLVLDHHTDVVRAFRDDSAAVPFDAWRNPAAVADAVSRLRHDEHFDWAVRSGLISGAAIVSHVRATPCADDRLILRGPECWPEENRQFSDPEGFRPLADGVLESSFLTGRLDGFVPETDGYILDIDCDYFLTERALHPEDGTFFRRLLRRAELITVSEEADWVRLLRLPGETITASRIVAELKRICREAESEGEGE